MAAGAAALAAVTATAGIALAAGDYVALPSTATLIARGVELSYAVHYSCPSSDQNDDIYIDARENVHGWMAHGSSWTYGLTCDGTNGRAFDRGQVYTFAALQSNTVTNVSTTKVVIVKR